MTPKYFSAEQVRAAVTMADAITAVRDGYIGLARGEFEMPTRTPLGDGKFLVMSVQHIPSATAIVKTLSLNFGGREPAIVGTVTWNDLMSDEVVIADAGSITKLRTAAAAGVATDLLAPPTASTMALIGAGGQAGDQVRAVMEVRPLTSLRIVARSIDRAEALAAELRGELPDVAIEASADIRTAVEDAEIVSCATTATEPLFELDWLRPDAHVNAIGAFRPTMRELPDELLAEVDTIYIDELESILEESGEILHALEARAITESKLVEIGRVLEAGPVARSGRTAFKSVGIAMQDWAIARLLAS